MPPLLDGATLLESLRQAAVLTDLSAAIVYWNRAAELLYGWQREDALGRLVFDVTPTTASRQQGEEIFEAVRLGQPWAGEYPVQRKDSSSFVAYVSLTPVRDAEGTLLGVLGLSENVAQGSHAEGRWSRPPVSPFPDDTPTVWCTLSSRWHRPRSCSGGSPTANVPPERGQSAGC